MHLEMLEPVGQQLASQVWIVCMSFHHTVKPALSSLSSLSCCKPKLRTVPACQAAFLSKFHAKACAIPAQLPADHMQKHIPFLNVVPKRVPYPLHSLQTMCVGFVC